MGEKPLYYGWQGGCFLFGSELKALKAHPAFTATVDRGALALAGCPERHKEYFLRGTTPSHVCPAGADREGRGDPVHRRFLRWLRGRQ